MMREIELRTRDGNFVARVDIFPFPGGGPEVVVWGTRTFLRRGTTDETPVYFEALTDVSLTPSPGRPRPPEAPPPPPPKVPPVNRSNQTTLHGTPIGEHTEILPNGMQKDYIVLTKEERDKGFARPFRNAYKHDKCGGVTSMGTALSETYARDPKFYNATYCATCKNHYPVGEKGEFTWTQDGKRVGT